MLDPTENHVMEGWVRHVDYVKNSQYALQVSGVRSSHIVP